MFQDYPSTLNLSRTVKTKPFDYKKVNVRLVGFFAVEVSIVSGNTEPRVDNEVYDKTSNLVVNITQPLTWRLSIMLLRFVERATYHYLYSPFDPLNILIFFLNLEHKAQ